MRLPWDTSDEDVEKNLPSLSFGREAVIRNLPPPSNNRLTEAQFVQKILHLKEKSVNKPREWRVPLNTLIVNSDPSGPQSEVIHVVEIYAYHKLLSISEALLRNSELQQAKIAELENQIEDMRLEHKEEMQARDTE